MTTKTDLKSSSSLTEKYAKRKDLIAAIDYLTDEQCAFLLEIIETGRKGMLRDVIRLSGLEGSYDTAIPIDYAERITLIYPNFRKGINVYDYRTSIFGEMLNVNDLFMQRLLKTMEMP